MSRGGTYVEWSLWKTFINVLFLEKGSLLARARISCLQEPFRNPGPLEKANLLVSLAIAILIDALCGNR